MADVKCVVGFKGKSYQKTLENEFDGMTIGAKVEGNLLGLKGYELQITGGSDKCGFPLRGSVEGPARKKGLFGIGIGVRKVPRKSARIRKIVVGNTISDSTRQINFKVLKVGSGDLAELMPKEEKSSEK